MKLVVLVTALAGTLLWFSGFGPFGSARTASENVQTLWYPNGQVQAKAALEAGVRCGPATEWYANGQERCSGAYDRGLREGAWVFYAEDGALDLERTGTYSAGARVGP
jgi:antitoxin component YwqK of YwqJK toxin-antitoxin module